MKFFLKFLGLSTLYLSTTYFLVHQFGFAIGFVFGVLIIPRVVDIISGRINMKKP